MPRKIIAFLVSFCLIFEQTGFAQIATSLGVPAYLNRVGPVADAFRPIHLRALTLQGQRDKYDLLLDKGDSKDLNPPQIESSAQKLLEYFRIGLVLPNSSFWVNLRPDAPEDIIDPEVEKTDIGRVFLEADVQLKKDMARFTSPDTPEGREYWDKLYAKAEEIFGPADVSIPTITRPWIVPGEIIIGESQGGAYIYKATLKVMLEQDYLKGSVEYSFEDERLRQLNDYSSEVLRRLIIPKLTREVNAAKRYASLRQVYYSLILAQWVKSRLRGQGKQVNKLTGEQAKMDSLFSKIDSRDLTGLASQKKWSKQTYYKEYQKSFRDGEYSMDETVYNAYGMTMRQYFSGGIAATVVLPSAVKAIPDRLIGPTVAVTVTEKGIVLNRSNDSEKKEPAAPQADGGTMKFLGEAKIGGEKQKEFWADEKGQLWIFKINPYGAQQYRPQGVQAYYAFVKRLYPDHPVFVRAEDPSGKSRSGTLEKVMLKKGAPMLDTATDQQGAAEYFRKYAVSNLKAEINAGNLKVTDLSSRQVEQVLREMVIDWLFSNHDSHPANFIIDGQGNIIGIDKEQVFKYFLDPAKDKLSLHNFPNGQSFAPLFYSVLINLAAKGKLSLGLIDEVLNSIEAVSDKEMTAMIQPFAKAYAQTGGITEQDFVQRFLARKHSLRQDFEKFFTQVSLTHSALTEAKIKQFFTIEKKEVKLLDHKADFLKQILEKDWQQKYVSPPKQFFTFLTHAVEKTPVSEKAEQEPVFHAQPKVIHGLSALYGMTRGIIARLKESVVPVIVIGRLIEEYYEELLSSPWFTAAQRTPLDDMKKRLLEFTRAPPEEIKSLKIKFVLLAEWIGEFRQRKIDSHRVYLARDAGFFHLFDRLLEQEESPSYYDAGSSVYYLSRSRMSGEPSQRAYSKMKNIISEAQNAVTDENLQAMYRQIRPRFRKEYAQDPQFRAMVDAIAAELREAGYDLKDKLIFVDTGFLGTIPFFLKNVLDLNKEEWELIDETGRERIQIGLMEPSNIMAFAKDLLGFDLQMFPEGARQRIEDLARPFGEGKNLGSSLEDIRAHPVRFDEGSWEIQYTDAATQLEFFYEQIIAVLAFFERRAAIEAVAGDQPEYVRRAVSRSMISQDIKTLLEFELTKKAPQDFFAKTEYASVLKKFLDNTQLYSIDTLKIPEVVHFSFAPTNLKPMKFILDNTMPERFIVIVTQLFKQFFNIEIDKKLNLKEAIALFRGADPDAQEEMLESLSEENRAIVENILNNYPQEDESKKTDAGQDNQKDGGRLAQLSSWSENGVQPLAHFYHGTSLQALKGTAEANRKNAGGYRLLARDKAEELKLRVWGGEKSGFLATIGKEYVSITGLYPIARGYAEKFSKGKNKEYMSLEAVRQAQQKAREGLESANAGSILMQAYTKELEDLEKREAYLLREITPEELAEETRQLSIPVVIGISRNVLSRSKDQVTHLLDIDELNVKEYVDLSEVTHVYTAQEHVQEVSGFLRAAGFAEIQVLPFEIMDFLFFSNNTRLSQFRDRFVDSLWSDDGSARTAIKQALQKSHLKGGAFSVLLSDELKAIEDNVNAEKSLVPSEEHATHRDGGAELLARLINEGTMDGAVQAANEYVRTHRPDPRRQITPKVIKDYALPIADYFLDARARVEDDRAWAEFVFAFIQQALQEIARQSTLSKELIRTGDLSAVYRKTDSLSIVIDQSAAELGLFSQLLSLERVRNPVVVHTPEKISSVKNIIEGVIARTRAQLNADEKTISVSVTGDASMITYKAVLDSLIWNYAANGIKYRDTAKAESRIEINIRQEDGKIIIAYADNGQGMTPEEETYFFKGAGVLPAKENSSGTGARIVLDTLRALGGEYRSYDSRSGQGTRFTIMLDRTRSVNYIERLEARYSISKHEAQNGFAGVLGIARMGGDEFLVGDKAARERAHELGDTLTGIRMAMEDIKVVLDIPAAQTRDKTANHGSQDGGDKETIDNSIATLSSKTTPFFAQRQARAQLVQTISKRLLPGTGHVKYFYDRETKALLEHAVTQLIPLLASDDTSVVSAVSLALVELIDMGCRCGYQDAAVPAGIAIEYPLLKELFEYDRQDRQRPLTEVTKKANVKAVREAGAYLFGAMLRNKSSWDAQDLAMISTYIGLDVIGLEYAKTSTNLSGPFFEGLASGYGQIQTVEPPGVFPAAKTIDKQELGEALTSVVPAGYTLIDSAGRTLIYKETGGTRYLAFKMLKKGEDVGILEYESQMFDYISLHKKALGLPENLRFPRSFLINGKRVVKVNVRQALNKDWPDKDTAVVLMAYEVDNPAYFSYAAGEGSKMNKAAFQKSLVESMNVLFTLARFGIVDTELIALFHHQADTSREDKGIYFVMFDALRALTERKQESTRWIDPNKKTVIRNGAGSLDGYIGSTNWPNIRQYPYPLADLATLFLVKDLTDTKRAGTGYMDNFAERGEVYSREVFYMGSFMGNYLLSAALLAGRYFRDRNLLDWQDNRSVQELADFMREVFISSLATFTQTDASNPELIALIDTVRWDRLARQTAYFMAADHPYAEHLFDKPLGTEQMKELFGDALVVFPQLDPSRPLPTGVVWDVEQGKRGWFSAEKKGDPSLGPFNGPLPLQELVTAIYRVSSYMLYKNNQGIPSIPGVSGVPGTQLQDGGMLSPALQKTLRSNGIVAVFNRQADTVELIWQWQNYRIPGGRMLSRPVLDESALNQINQALANPLVKPHLESEPSLRPTEENRDFSEAAADADYRVVSDEDFALLVEEKGQAIPKNAIFAQLRTQMPVLVTQRRALSVADGGMLSGELQKAMIKNRIVAVFSTQDEGLKLIWQWQDYEKRDARMLSRPVLNDFAFNQIKQAIEKPAFTPKLEIEASARPTGPDVDFIPSALYRVVSNGAFVLLVEKNDQALPKNDIFSQLQMQILNQAAQRKATSLADGGVEDIADVIPEWGKFRVVNKDRDTIAEFFRDRIAGQKLIAMYFKGTPDKDTVVAVAALAAQFSRENRDIQKIISGSDDKLLQDWLVLVNGRFVASYGSQARTFSSREYPDAEPSDIARLTSSKAKFRDIPAEAYLEDLRKERDAITPLEFWEGAALDGGKKDNVSPSKQKIIKDFTNLIGSLEKSGQLSKGLGAQYRSVLRTLLSPSRDVFSIVGFGPAAIIADQLRELRRLMEKTKEQEPEVSFQILPVAYELARSYSGYKTNDIREEVDREATNTLNYIATIQQLDTPAVTSTPSDIVMPMVEASGKDRKDGGKGGIDLRSLPIAIQPTVAPAPGTAPAMQPVRTIADLNKEWSQLQKQMQDEAMPYVKIKQYVTCCRQQKAQEQLDTVVAYIAAILRLEEERAVETTPELKEILVSIG